MSKNFTTNSSFIPAKTGTPPRKKRVKVEYPWGKDEEVEILQDTIFSLEREIEDLHTALRHNEEYYERLLAEMRSNETTSVQTSDTLRDAGFYGSEPTPAPRRTSQSYAGTFDYSTASVGVSGTGSSGRGSR